MNLDNQSSKPSGRTTSLGLFFIFAVSIIAAVYRFLPWTYSVIYGDGLDYYLSFLDGRCATRASDILVAVCHERFRPVASSIVLAMMNIFGAKNFDFFAVNILLQGLAAVLVFAISQRLSRGNFLVSASVTMTMAVSRFAIFDVTQLIGPVEGVPLLLTLAAVYSVLRAEQQPEHTWRWCWTAIVFCLFATFAHERFMVVAVWLGIPILLTSKLSLLSRKRTLTLLAACAAIPLFYITYKQLFLQTYFLIGTSDTHLKLDVPAIIQHARETLASIFGFNQGPDYLVGQSVTIGWNYSFVLAILFTFIFAALTFLGVLATQSVEQQHPSPIWLRLRWLALLLILAAFLVAPALLTIRFEQRWLYASFVFVLLVASWAAGAGTGKLRVGVSILAVLLCMTSVTLDTLLMKQFGRLFFVSSPRFAELVKRDVVDKHPLQTKDIAFLADTGQCNWTLLGGGFFRIYGGASRRVYCFASLDAAADAKLPTGTHIYEESSRHQLVDMSNELSQVVAQRSEAFVTFSFLKAFANGRISDTSKVDTPAGQGVLVMPWNTLSGARKALTVISGFSYRYDDVPIAASAQLRFAVGMVYPSPQPARAIVRLSRGEGAPLELYSRDLTPPEAGTDLRFEAVSIPLKDYAGQHVSISFAVESPGGNSAGHWVAFVDPRVVVVDATK